MRTIAISLLACLTCAVSSWVHAADNGVYLGLGVSQSSVDANIGSIPIDGDNTKFKVIAGVRPLDWLAFEANYVDFGSIDRTVGATRSEFKLKGIDAFAVGLFEIVVVDLFAKAGVVRWDQDIRVTNLPSRSDTGYDAVFGGGVQAHFGSLGVRAEYEKFNLDDADVDMISVGVTWTFL